MSSLILNALVPFFNWIKRGRNFYRCYSFQWRLLSKPMRKHCIQKRPEVFLYEEFSPFWYISREMLSKCIIKKKQTSPFVRFGVEWSCYNMDICFVKFEYSNMIYQHLMSWILVFWCFVFNFIWNLS